MGTKNVGINLPAVVRKLLVNKINSMEAAIFLLSVAASNSSIQSWYHGRHANAAMKVPTASRVNAVGIDAPYDWRIITYTFPSIHTSCDTTCYGMLVMMLSYTPTA